MPTAPRGAYNQELNMRRPVNKGRSARKFRRSVSRTKAINVIPMRGGYRL